MPSWAAARRGSAITAPEPHSCAPVTMVAEPSPLNLMYAPDEEPNDGHQPMAKPIASSAGSSRP